VSSLLGLHVKLPDARRCGSDVAVIGEDNVLTCRSCRRRCGFLSQFTANWLQQVAAKFGAPEVITLRTPPRKNSVPKTDNPPALPVSSKDD
jgi:hypothetical protein